MALFVANNGQLQTVKGIYYGMAEDYINATLFHNLVPKTATEIKFLYADNNFDFTDYQRIGYCDNNNFIEVWNSGTKYIIINPRKNYIYAPINCNNFLYNYTALTSCIFDNFNTMNTTNMGSMFERCNHLVSLDLSDFNTQNCSDMRGMFHYCNALKTIDLSSFNTEKITSCYCMFRFCQKLLSLDLSNFNTAKVTNMDGMFSQCNNLQQLNLSSFNTEKVTTFSGFLNRNYHIMTLDLSSFNTVACKNFISMFERTNIKTIISNTFDITSKLSDSNMFYQSYSLIGGNGTTYSSSHNTAEYARVDGENDLPGYFTAPTN